MTTQANSTTTTISKFPATSCSQCGGTFGPGDHGFSHCDQHRVPRPVPAILYIPQIQDATPGKFYIPELRASDMSLHTIVADIASAQHDNVVRVIAIDLMSGTSRDASKEIAHHVLAAVLEDEYHVPDWCRDFLEEHLGANYVRSTERAVA